jgi:hypothetical protein
MLISAICLHQLHNLRRKTHESLHDLQMDVSLKFRPRLSLFANAQPRDPQKHCVCTVQFRMTIEMFMLEDLRDPDPDPDPTQTETETETQWVSASSRLMLFPLEAMYKRHRLLVSTSVFDREEDEPFDITRLQTKLGITQYLLQSTRTPLTRA